MGAIEFEARILDIDPGKISERILGIGGKFIAELNFRRYVFDTIPAQKGKWVRLRTDGSESTLAFKYIKTDEIDGTQEWETKVSDFDETLEILQNFGVQYRSYQENIRHLYTLNDVEVAIDIWPQIPPYLEIEAANSEIVYDTVVKLGFARSDLVTINNDKIYAEYGIDLSSIKDLRFKD